MNEAAKPLKAGRPAGATSADPAVARAFGEAVVNMRREAKISQENLALLAGVDRSYMGKLERGQGAPNIVAVVRIAAALGCSATELVRRFEEVLQAAMRPASEAAGLD
ncbi:helix-turn-helix domain-containing protein [Rubrivivax rivuli]|uniref:XRE family transcriptional regulator n=1 Tax=Rubrivivax rivuli TaxID=1862385 RepID=A0A437R9A4_9BURK|nr:helix-turn-helix transcriptional regulator [Rubrivivax rivuli]RVU43360.1 XRE family transcriptional regulator [Rubrivivax rivuli]